MADTNYRTAQRSFLVSWLDVSVHFEAREKGSPVGLSLQRQIDSVVTLSTMRKLGSVSPFSQVTSPTSLTARGRISRTSWAIIPRPKHSSSFSQENSFLEKILPGLHQNGLLTASRDIFANRCLLPLFSFCFDL